MYTALISLLHNYCMQIWSAQVIAMEFSRNLCQSIGDIANWVIICYLPPLQEPGIPPFSQLHFPFKSPRTSPPFFCPKTAALRRNYAMSHQETWREPITCTSARRLTGPMELTMKGWKTPHQKSPNVKKKPILVGLRPQLSMYKAIDGGSNPNL